MLLIICRVQERLEQPDACFQAHFRGPGPPKTVLSPSVRSRSRLRSDTGFGSVLRSKICGPFRIDLLDLDPLILLRSFLLNSHSTDKQRAFLSAMSRASQSPSPGSTSAKLLSLSIHVHTAQVPTYIPFIFPYLFSRRQPRPIYTPS